MTYPPPDGTPDPYQPTQPYGQQPVGKQPGDPSYPYTDPYANPAGTPAAWGAPSSGQPYSAPSSGQPYSGQPYGVPASGQPYGAPPGYPPVYGQNPTTNTMAILSLVFAFVFSPLAIVFGHMAKKQIKERGEQGDGLATAGLILGYVFTGFYVLACCGWLVVVIGAGTAGSS